MHRRVFKGIIICEWRYTIVNYIIPNFMFRMFLFLLSLYFLPYDLPSFISAPLESLPDRQINSTQLLIVFTLCNISRYIYPQSICSLSFSNRLNRPCLTKIFQWYLTRHLPSEKFRLSSTDKNCNSFPCPWNFPLYMNYPISSRLFSGYI